MFHASLYPWGIIEKHRRRGAFEQPDAQADHKYVVDLTDERDEVGDELDWTCDIQDGASAS
jgi:hypothetical protein